MKALLICLAPALASGLAAQSSYTVLPRGFETFQTYESDQSYLGQAGKDYKGTVSYTPMHVQTGYALAELGMSSLKARTLSYRRNNYYVNPMYKSAQTLAIYMSHSLVKTTAWSTTFKSNEGTARTQVFGSGGKPALLNWPAAPYVENGRMPVPFALHIPLATPYLITRSGGQSLCIDFEIASRISTYQSGSNTYHMPLFLDAARKTHGLIEYNGTIGLQCKLSNGKYPNNGAGRFDGLTTLGGAWYASYVGLPSRAWGVATLSSMGVKTKPNPFKLPIDLTPLGMPTCLWNVGLETSFWLTLRADVAGTMWWPSIRVPKGLPVSSFFDQCLILDPKANSFGLVSTYSREWKILQAIEPGCVTLYKHQDTTPPSTTGALVKGFAAIIRLDS